MAKPQSDTETIPHLKFEFDMDMSYLTEEIGVYFRFRNKLSNTRANRE
jgi:hypothetical protein